MTRETFLYILNWCSSTDGASRSVTDQEAKAQGCSYRKEGGAFYGGQSTGDGGEEGAVIVPLTDMAESRGADEDRCRRVEALAVEYLRFHTLQILPPLSVHAVS